MKGCEIADLISLTPYSDPQNPFNWSTKRKVSEPRSLSEISSFELTLFALEIAALLDCSG